MFQFAAEAFRNEGLTAEIDQPYREYIWSALLQQPDIYVGKAVESTHAKTKKRTSVLGKAPPESHAPQKVTPASLSLLCEQYGDALRVAMDANRVRQKLTRTEDPSYLSAAAYHVLQHVSRARAQGTTVVNLGQVTGYDQKTVFYLVKALIERDLVYVLFLTQRQIPGT